MAWTTPDYAFLELRMITDFDALEKVAKQRGRSFTAIVNAVIRDQVELVRGYVSGNPSNTLGPEGSIPPAALAPFVTLARLALIATLPGGVVLADDLRRSQEKNAMATLEAISRGAIRITPATETATAQPDDAGGVSGSPEAPLNWGTDAVLND